MLNKLRSKKGDLKREKWFTPGYIPGDQENPLERWIGVTSKTETQPLVARPGRPEGVGGSFLDSCSLGASFSPTGSESTRTSLRWRPWQ